VAGAVRLGMHGVLYRSLEQFRHDIEADYELPLPSPGAKSPSAP